MLSYRFRALVALVFCTGFSFTLPALGNPLNQWEISCTVDGGAITRKFDSWVFRTSSNRCKGGVFKQRAELATEEIRPTQPGSYLFQTEISFTSASSEPFGFFQVHDGRFGCAPPMSLMVQANGGLEIRSDVKMGEGENCIRGKSLSKNRNIIRRDGKPQLLEVLVTFDGQGGFETTVWVDKKFEIRTNYVSPDVPGAFLSEKFFFKHGVYSLNMFVYVMISRGMKVREVRISN